ncbi:MAG: putative bacilysin exporter BacE [Firmicutes bacterium]|nr:putative bacilysin exporter BacE [candidate division NPL-UPA2 bacterium]
MHTTAEVPVLRNKAFLILWGGQIVSMLGDALFSLALMWWVVSETGSGVAVAFVVLASSVPRLLLAPIVGVYVDRVDKRRMMLFADTLLGVITLGMTMLFWRGHFSLPVIIAAAALLGAASSLDGPAYEATIPAIVGKNQLVRANSLMQTANSIIGLLAPALSGLVIAVAGVGVAILANSISFFFAAFTLLLISLPAQSRVIKQRAFGRDLRDGAKFILGNRLLLPMLLYAALINLSLAPISVSMPLLVTNVLRGGPQLLGLFGSFQSVGVLAASLLLSAKPALLAATGKVMIFSLIALGCFTVIIARAKSAPHLLLGGAAVGFALVVANVASRTIWQREVPEEYRGRAFTARDTVSGALRPMGQALAGPMVDTLGPMWLIAGAGALCVVGGILGLGVRSIITYPEKPKRASASM